MKSSLFHFVAYSAVFLSSICQAAPMGRNFDITKPTIQQLEERIPNAPKTKLFITGTDVSSDAATNTESKSSSDDSEISVFEIRDISGKKDEIKRILLPKALLNKAVQESTTVSGSGAGGNAAALGGVVECGVDKVGRNYCRTSDGWYEYRCETGEIAYFRQMPYADEEVCSDGSIA